VAHRKFQQESGRIMVGIRPRSKFVLEVKDRHCPKCGAKINNQRVRCKKCSQELSRPAKRKGKTKPKKARMKTRAKRRAKLGT
jgi:predicted amidophosphoribosyltransferase